MYNITFPIDKFNTSFQLLVDNFPSFTVLRPLPEWYEGEDGGRAAGPGAAAGRMSKMAENLGVWSLHLSC